MLELSYGKPANFQHQKGQYTILNLMKPKITELDLPYRWLPLASSPEEDKIRFHVELNGSSFSKSCGLVDIGDKAIVYGPMA